MSVAWNCGDDTEYLVKAIHFFAEVCGKPKTASFSDFSTKYQGAILQKAQEYKAHAKQEERSRQFA